VRGKNPSRADQRLLEELARRGCKVQFTQIERWRYRRRTGLIPRTVQHGLGRGSYSEHAVELEEAADRICEVAELLSRYHSLDGVALVLSARGRPIDPTNVKLALGAVLTSTERSFRSHKPASNDPVEVAQNAARALTRALSRGARTSDAPNVHAPLPMPTDALAICGRILAGVPVPRTDVETFLDGSGLTAIAATLRYSRDDLVALVERAAPSLSFQAMHALVDSVSGEAVVHALQTSQRAVSAFIPAAFFPSPISRDVAVVGIAIGLLAADSLGHSVLNP
jgi:hypothetical protein